MDPADVGKIIYAVCAGAVTLLVIVFAVYAERLHRRLRKLLEAQVEQLELENQDQKSQISYLINWCIQEDQLECREKIAAGSEGEVWLGNLKGRDKPVAIKKAWSPDSQSESEGVWHEAEVVFMMAMQHPRLVEFLGAGRMAEPRDPNGRPLLFTVQEFMSGGSLDKPLWGTPRDSLTWEQRLGWATDTAEGMAFIHEKGCIHRDLKSMNVLFDADTMRAKVADFGIARAVDQSHGQQLLPPPTSPRARLLGCAPSEAPLRSSAGKTDPRGKSLMTAVCGTAPWMAPELCKTELLIAENWEDAVKKGGHAMEAAKAFSEKHRRARYSPMVDVYSFGLLMYEILAHAAPWAASPQKEIFHAVAADGERPVVTAELQKEAAPWCELMVECWAQHAPDRPNFEAILQRLRLMKVHSNLLIKNSLATGIKDCDLSHSGSFIDPTYSDGELAICI